MSIQITLLLFGGFCFLIGIAVGKEMEKQKR